MKIKEGQYGENVRERKNSIYGIRNKNVLNDNAKNALSKISKYTSLFAYGSELAL